mgnify:CR=1
MALWWKSHVYKRAEQRYYEVELRIDQKIQFVLEGGKTSIGLES